MSASLPWEPREPLEDPSLREVTARPRCRRERFVCVECDGKAGFYDCPDCQGTGTVE